MSIIDYDILEDYSVEELKIKIFKKQEVMTSAVSLF